MSLESLKGHGGVEPPDLPMFKGAEVLSDHSRDFYSVSQSNVYFLN